MGQPPADEFNRSPGADPRAYGSDAATCQALAWRVCELLMGPDPAQALERALEAVGHAVGGQVVCVLGPVRETGAVVQEAGWRRDGTPWAASRVEEAPPGLVEVIREGRVLDIPDVTRMSPGPDQTFWTRRGVRAVLGVPMPAGLGTGTGASGGGGLVLVERHQGPAARWDAPQHEALACSAGPLALAVCRNRQRCLAQHAADMISAHDAEGRFVAVSPACRTLLGYAPEDLLGTDPRTISHPEDRAGMLRAHQQMRHGGREVRYTWRGLHRQGRDVWLESTCSRSGPERVVVTREIGGRLNAELHLRLVQSAVEQVNEGVVITDGQITAPGPKIVYVNPAFTRMTGYAQEELVGRTPRLLQGPDTDPAVLARMRGALQRGEATEGEAVNYRRDGSTYLAHWSIHPLRDAAGNLSHWVSVQRDASERRADEDLERRHREELAHVTRLSMMGELASGLAHEINQPLASISAYVEGLQTRLGRDNLPPDVLGDILGRVADQAETASQIVRRLRSFVVKREVVRSLASVNDLVRETLSLLDGDLNRRGFEVCFDDVGQGLPAVSVDAVQIQQVLVNLIRNAVDASEAATPEVGDPPREVEVVTTLDGSEGVRVDVIDRGVGLSAQRLARIFDPFFSTKDDGMGMGLTISRSIIAAHGGRLWAAANPRLGCTFSLVLPAARGSGGGRA